MLRVVASLFILLSTCRSVVWAEPLTDEAFEIAPPLHELMARDNVGCRRTCPTEEDGMPMWGNWQGCQSSYQNGSGTLLLNGETDEQDLYNHWRAGNVGRQDNCWTNVYSVHNQTLQLPWQLIEDAIDCGRTSSCTSAQGKSESRCITNSFSIGLGVEIPILGPLFAALGIGFEMEQTETNCVASNLTIACTWDDGLCHALWGSDQVVRVWGYIERFCDFADDGLPGRVIWSHDFIMDVPTGKIATGCGALCNDATYEGPARATALATQTQECTSATTWSDFSQVSAAAQTISFASGENPTTAWAQVLAYTSDGAAAEDTSVPTAGSPGTRSPSDLSLGWTFMGLLSFFLI